MIVARFYQRKLLRVQQIRCPYYTFKTLHTKGGCMHCTLFDDETHFFLFKFM